MLGSRTIAQASAAVALLFAGLAGPAVAQEAPSPLFSGDTANLWLVDPETGQVTGYSDGAWLNQVTKDYASLLGIGVADPVLINALPSSTVPMTPGQPAVSFIGIGDAALALGAGDAGGHRDLVIDPDGGDFTGTVAVTIGVSAERLAAADHALSWSITDTATTAVVRSDTVTLARSADVDGENGYYQEVLYLVDNGSYSVSARLSSGGSVVATDQANFTLVIDPSQQRRDTDGDGIPDAVEIDMGLNPLEDDWTADTDSDGWSEFDEWLRRYCLDPATGAPVAGDTNCLDAAGLPLDSDADNWSDFDEILRGTNHLDPEPQLGEPVTGIDLGDGSSGNGGGSTGTDYPLLDPGSPTTVQDAQFCTDGDIFYFDLRFFAEADDVEGYDIIVGVGADGFPFRSGEEAIRANFGEQTQITRQEPIVRSSAKDTGEFPPDRWLDGPIADFNIEPISGSNWRVHGSVPVGTEPFAPGDTVSTFALRAFVSGSASGGNYVVSADPADCTGQVTSPEPDGSLATEFDEQQRLRFKDYPAASRLYEVERTVAPGAGSLVTPPPAAVTAGQQSTGAAAGDPYPGIVVQSFTAAADNLAGVDVVVTALAGETRTRDDITLNVWQGSLRDGELLVSHTLKNVPIEPGTALPVGFRFEPVALQPGQPVYLEFRKAAAALQTTGTDTLTGGGVTEIDGTPAAGDTDLVLTLFNDTAFADGIGGTRQGMRWWNVAAADLTGRVAFDAATLLRDDEIVAAGLTPDQIAPRRRMSGVGAALAADDLPEMRLPAGDSLVLGAVHRYMGPTDTAWEPPLGYSRVYKLWLPRESDVTPVDMLTDRGEGTWTTPDEWRAAFVDFLASRLVLPATPTLDEAGTLQVAVIESALSEEARLDGEEDLQILTRVFQPGLPVYEWLPAEPVFGGLSGEPSPYVSEWEDALRALGADDFTLDDSHAEVVAALTAGNPLAALGDWLRTRFYAGVPGSRSDEYMAGQLRRSFDGSCFQRSDLLPVLQAETGEWNAFLDRCPEWFDEAGLDARLEADRERRYQVRLNLLPGAAPEIVADATLLDRNADSDADGYLNMSEVGVPVGRLTLPWVTDSDGDGIADGDDQCPNDAFNECSSNPVLPTVTVEADFVVFEPAGASGSALVAVQLNRMYDEAVTVCYEAFVDAADTATAGEDFQAVTGCFTIEPGQMSALIEVPIFADGAAEGAESFSVRITSADNATVADDGIVLVTLNDTEASALPPDVLLASNAIVAAERDPVTLDASGSTDPNGETLSYSWVQIDTGAPTVALQGSDTSQATFTAPVTLQSLDLEFEVAVTNQSGLADLGQVTVTVNPVNDPPFVAAVPFAQVASGDTFEWTYEQLLAFVEDPDEDILTTGAILRQPSIGRVEDTGTSFLYSSSTEPVLALDQVNDPGVSGGIGTPVVQTFVPQQTNLAGVDAYLNGTSQLTADVTVNVWFAGAVGVGEPLATATITDHPRLTEIPFRFDPIPVVPGQPYALEFRFSTLLIGTTGDSYPDGEVVGRTGSDVFFRTYYDEAFVPSVPLADQVSGGTISGGLGDPVVQTFVPQQTSLTGIDAFLSGTGAFSSDVTVNVWPRAALRVGEPIVTATLPDVPRSTLMQFRFDAVPVVPGTEYAMEFIIADALVMGAVVPGQYPDGAVIEGGGNLFNGGVDLLFTTYYDAAFTPANLLAGRLSDPQIVSWEVFADGDRVILSETGAAEDFAGTDRVVAYDLATRTRSLVLDAAADGFSTTRGAPAAWFLAGGELFRYDPAAAETLISVASPETLTGVLADDTAVDPRTGDLHYCGPDPAAGENRWYRVDAADGTVSSPYGSCGGSAPMKSVVVDQRYCALLGESGLSCTEPGGDQFTAAFTTTDFGASVTDDTLLGIEQTGATALLFASLEEAGGEPIGFATFLIAPGAFVVDDSTGEPLLEPAALIETLAPIDVAPETAVMPDGRVVMIVSPSARKGNNGDPLSMLTWSGDPADGTVAELNIGVFPALSNHTGALRVIGGQLYWQVQDHDTNAERFVYRVKPAAGVDPALELYATVPGSFDRRWPVETSESAPYDLLVAAPDTFGAFVSTATPGVCDVLLVPSLDVAQEGVGCRPFASVEAGALYEAEDGDGDPAPDSLYLFGTGNATTGETSFGIEVTDGEFVIELPVEIEVVAP
ncbi:PKD domain-containing protein [Lentisalinibacter sediminis]|uniref:PKD domain-containing protein n=1 Tax=Lentisalinibacter sediminis TaxID=2992237 RepID=UPI00386B79CE